MKTASLFSLCAMSLFAISMAFGQGPMQMGKPTAADQARLTKLEKAYKAAKAAYAKSPKSAKARKDVITIGDAYANESMNSPVLTPHVKYTQALHLFREVLKVDPSDKTAKSESELIISIYKQMGRPVPAG